MKRNDLIEQFLRIVLTRLYPRYFGHILPSIGGGGGGFGVLIQLLMQIILELVIKIMLEK